MARARPESVDLVLTDPPYGMGYRSNMRIARERFDAIDNDASFDPEFTLRWMRECYRLLKNDRHLYAFCSDHHLGEFRTAVAGAGFAPKRTLVWIKSRKAGGVMGDLDADYAHQTEFILFAHKGRRDLFHGRHANVIEAGKVPPQQMQHPTQKPTGLLRPLVLNSTHHDEVILDPFAGSGSTGVVAREEGRDYVLIEQDPRYVRVAQERLAQGGLF